MTTTFKAKKDINWVQYKTKDSNQINEFNIDNNSWNNNKNFINDNSIFSAWENINWIQMETEKSFQNNNFAIKNIKQRFKKEPIFMTIFLWLLVNWLYDIIKFIFTLTK